MDLEVVDDFRPVTIPKVSDSGLIIAIISIVAGAALAFAIAAFLLLFRYF